MSDVSLGFDIAKVYPMYNFDLDFILIQLFVGLKNKIGQKENV